MRNRKVYIYGVLITIVVLIVALYKFVDTIIQGEWDEKKAAVEKAYQETMLAKAVRVEPYVGDTPYMIVYGEDRIGKPMIVWVSETAVYSEYEENGIGADDVASKLKQTDPATEIIRITPGRLSEDLVWEAYYKRELEGKAHHFYDYYRFSDGSHLDTYQLSISL